MQTKVLPFFLFEGKAEEAMSFYASLFPESGILDITRYGPQEMGAEGSVKKARFSVAGQHLMCTDSVVKHAFTFTPAISFFVSCESDQEIRRLSSALSEGGTEFMPLGAYGFSRQFAWVGDPFGVSWQHNLE